MTYTKTLPLINETEISINQLISFNYLNDTDSLKMTFNLDNNKSIFLMTRSKVINKELDQYFKSGSKWHIKLYPSPEYNEEIGFYSYNIIFTPIGDTKESLHHVNSIILESCYLGTRKNGQNMKLNHSEIKTWTTHRLKIKPEKIIVKQSRIPSFLDE